MTEAWWAHLRSARPALTTLLPADETTKLRDYRQAADRSRHLVGWALARAVLGDALQCAPPAVPIHRFCTHCRQPGHGKPQVKGDGPHFSISHAGDYVVVAVTDDGPVGVDVELITRGDDKIDRRVRAPGERSAGGADLVRRWVRKEAVLKATGHGFAVPMTRFAVSPPDARARLLTWPDDPTLPERLGLDDLPCPGLYAAAVAVIGPRRGPVRCRDGSARLAALD